MATFVSLINWTEQGIKNFRDTPKRAKAFRELVLRSPEGTELGRGLSTLKGNDTTLAAPVHSPWN